MAFDGEGLGMAVVNSRSGSSCERDRRLGFGGWCVHVMTMKKNLLLEMR